MSVYDIMCSNIVLCALGNQTKGGRLILRSKLTQGQPGHLIEPVQQQCEISAMVCIKVGLARLVGLFGVLGW